MKSGSWSAYQSALPPEARAGGEPDDDPPRRTIPETVVPEQRYAQAAPHGRWDVYDWVWDGEPEQSALVPEMVCADLSEFDARLLVAGVAMLDVLELLRKLLRHDPAHIQWDKVADDITAALKVARGE